MMKNLHLTFFAIASIGCLFGEITIDRAQAITLSDGTTYFDNPPRFINATTSQDGTYIWGATYYFTISMPDNAGEPLQKVVIQQESGTSRPVFDPQKTAVFEGTRNDPGEELPIQEVDFDPETQAITVIFDPPIEPGKMITIRFHPVRNPGIGGRYLYGIAAFPVGTQPHGQFLGYGEIRIYDNQED
jgi:Protein of unknown function (DUF2808)